jgi:hypothetical protein
MTVAGKGNSDERRYDIDWLRILAVLLLVPYHTAVIFNRGYVSYIKTTPSAAMEAFAYFMNQWHMSLFFLVSGAATWFSLGSRTGKLYLAERVRRLLVPLVFGTLAIVPVQVYLQRLYYHEFSGSYFQFYPHVFDGIYPHGNFTWGQLWFLAYLFVFSSLALPLFLYLKTHRGTHLLSRAAAFVEKPGAIFLAALPLAVIQALLRAKWPGFQNLYDDWANFAFYLTVFCYGYVLCSDMRFTNATEKHRGPALLFALLSMSVILALRQTGAAPAPDYSPAWILYMLLHGFSSWCWLVAFLGFGRKYLRFSNRLREYGTEAALPFYILHHAVIVATAYRVIQWNTCVTVKFLAITTVALAGTVIIYDLCVRRWPPLRFLFGMKNK